MTFIKLITTSDNIVIPEYINLVIILILIFTMGRLGGKINYYLKKSSFEQKYKKTSEYKLSIWSGTGASFLVPLFLNTISSTLLIDVRTHVEKYFVLAGFLLLASIFSEKFITSMWSKIIKQLENEVNDLKEAHKDMDPIIANHTEPETESDSDTSDTETEVSSIPNKAISQSSDNQNYLKDDVVKYDTSSDNSKSHNSPPVKNTIRKKVTLPKVSPIKLTPSSRKNSAVQILSATTDSEYSFRTLSGIANDTNLDKKLVNKTLTKLISNGYIRSSIRKDGGLRFNCTDTGRLYLHSLSKK